MSYQHGEANGSGGPFGRYHAVLPAAAPGPDYTLTFAAPGYVPQNVQISVPNDETALLVDVALVPAAGGALSYCTAKTNSCGTQPGIAASGQASASASSGFVVSASGAQPGKLGLLIYTNTGRQVPAAPFGNGGFLCINPPVRRAPIVTASGGTTGNCDATFAVDMNAFAAGQLGGNPQAYLSVPGALIDAHWWGRDSAAVGDFLSDAIEYGVCP